jgi:hypothetical protein
MQLLDLPTPTPVPETIAILTDSRNNRLLAAKSRLIGLVQEMANTCKYHDDA